VVAGPGLKAFFRITGARGLKDAERRLLLGSPGRTTYYRWKKGGASTLKRDTLERLSYVLGIHKALAKLLSAANQRHWLRTANDDPPFTGRPPIQHMLPGSMVNLAEVRRYLDAAQGYPANPRRDQDPSRWSPRYSAVTATHCCAGKPLRLQVQP
jgi:hypothetical protein